MGRGLHNHDTYLHILEMISKQPNITLPEIRKALHLTPQHLNYYIRRLEKWGYITIHKSYPRTVQLTVKGKEALYNGRLKEYAGSQSGRQGGIRYHALQVLIPVLRKGRDIKGHKVKGWARKVLDVDIPDVTVEEMESKEGHYLRLYVHDIVLPRNKHALQEFQNTYTRLLYVVNAYFSRYGWVLDIFHAKIIHQHIATKAEEYDGEAQHSVSVEFPRKQVMLDGTEGRQNAKAWLDTSEGILEIETQDALYEKKLIMMPEYVHDLHRKTIPTLNRFAEQLELHLDTLQQIALSINTLNKLLKRLEDKL